MSEINVLSKTQTIVVDPISGSVSIINAGPPGPAGTPGPAGPPGPPGGPGTGSGFPITENDGTNTYTIDTTSDSSTITINNHLNATPGLVRAEITAYADVISLAQLEAASGSEISVIRAFATTGSPHSGAWFGNGDTGAFLLVGSIDPDGVIVSDQGSLFIDTATAAIYQNTDGDAAWRYVSGGAGENVEEYSYRYVRSSAATTWTITHDLSFTPNVTVVDSTGREIVPDIVYTSPTVVTLTFSTAVGGEAYLS